MSRKRRRRRKLNGFFFFFPFAARTPLITSSQIEATKDWDGAAALPVVAVICCLSAGEIKNT